MKYINHVTLNTGHIRKSYASEIDRGIYFVLNRIINDSLRPEGTEIYERYRLKATRDGNSAIATIFAEADGVPILTTACSSDDDGSLWSMLHESSPVPLETNPLEPVPTPYIADRLEIGAMVYAHALQRTGDLARCFGWMMLDPREIRR